jgi:hypothetical protein
MTGRERVMAKVSRFRIRSEADMNAVPYDPPALPHSYSRLQKEIQARVDGARARGRRPNPRDLEILKWLSNEQAAREGNGGGNG